MKLKNSHCMNRKLTLFAAMLFFTLAASAQPFEKAVRSNLWNDGSNANGMRQDTRSISYAEIYGGFKSGDYHDTHEYTKGWTAGAKAASVQHLKKFSMSGSFGFEQTQGQEMCGSMFINPGFYPIDVLEFTPGSKTLQTYTFSGGISVDVAPNWRVGGKIDFESANYSKRKDLRHTNYRLDFELAPGIQYHDGDLAIGLNYIFSRNSENVDAEQIGTGKESLFAFLDKGMMYGSYEIWDGSGVHLSTSGISIGLPLTENIHGVAAQLSWKGFFAEAKWRHRKGLAGEKQYIWYRFPGSDAAFTVGYSFDSRHFLRLRWDDYRQNNSETVIENVTVGGITNPVEHGSNLLSQRINRSIRQEYDFYGSKLEIRENLSFGWRGTQSSPMYPFVYAQHISDITAFADVLGHAGRWDIGTGVLFTKASCREESRSVDSGSGVATEPYRLSDWNQAHLDYICNPALTFLPHVRFNFAKDLYLQVSGLAATDFDSFRGGATLKFGYNF